MALFAFATVVPEQGAVVGRSLVAARKDGGVVTVAGAVKLRRTLVPFILFVVRVALIEIADDRLHLQRVHDGLFSSSGSRPGAKIKSCHRRFDRQSQKSTW